MKYEDKLDFIKRHRWQFAKTYAEFAPHEYLVRNWIKSPTDREDYLEFCRAIFEEGETLFYNGKRERKYLKVDDKWYWCMDATPEEATIINRCEVDDYIVTAAGNMYYDKKRRAKQKE